jgi:hypothetical protein
MPERNEWIDACRAPRGGPTLPRFMPTRVEPPDACQPVLYLLGAFERIWRFWRLEFRGNPSARQGRQLQLIVARGRGRQAAREPDSVTGGNRRLGRNKYTSLEDL